MRWVWGLTAWLILLAGSTEAACLGPDGGRPTVSREYKISALVLIGQAESQQYDPNSTDGYFLDGTRYLVRPLQVFKGHPSRVVSVFSENSSGRFPMASGVSYILFLYRDHGRYQVNNCGNSTVSTGETRALLDGLRKLAARKRQAN